MELDWREDDDAPAPGARVGPLSDFAEEGARFVDIGGFSMVVVRRGGDLTAFWNVCPHQFLPLNWRGARVMSADGALLRCTNHGASFRVEDGAPAGEGADAPCGLSQVPVRAERDHLVIGEA